MKNCFCSLLLVLIAQWAKGQTENAAVEPIFTSSRTLRVGLSFTPGFMPKQNLVNSYLVGDLEYYLSPKLSVVGAGVVFLSSGISEKEEAALLAPIGVGALLKMNHQLYTGLHFHFLKNKAFDPYIGFQPGFAVSKTNDNYYDATLTDSMAKIVIPRHDTRVSFNPMMAFDLGFNFYAVKYFHLFVNSRYVMGRHLGGFSPYKLNEIMVSFGLGINLSVKTKAN